MHRRNHLGSAVLVLLLAGCQAQPPEKLGSVSAALEATRLDFSLRLPVAYSTEAPFAITAERALRMADRSKTVTEDTNGAVASVGAGSVEIGCHGAVAGVYSRGAVTLREHAEASGTVYTKSTADLRFGASAGAVVQGATIFPTRAYECSVVFPAGTAPDVALEPDQQTALIPGRYGTVSVKSRAKLTLAEGVYYIGNLRVLEPDSQLILTGPVRMKVLGELVDRGVVLASGGGAVDLAITYLGTSTVFLENSLVATVAAPRADLVLAASNKTYQGTFVGVNVEVRPDIVVRPGGVPPEILDDCRPVSEVVSEPQVSSNGPPPALVGPPEEAATRVASFLDWATGARVADRASAIVAVQAVEGDGAIAQALIAEFQANRDANVTRALRALTALGELRSVEGEGFFIGLVREPLPAALPEPGAEARFSKQIGYQVKAVHALGYMFSRASTRELQRLISKHPERLLRTEALRTFLFDQPEAVREAIRPYVRAEDAVYLDRFENVSLEGRSFDEDLSDFLAKHPELTPAP